MGRCPAWQTHQRLGPAARGSRRACGLNRSAPPTPLTCGACTTTTRYRAGTTPRSRVVRRQSSGRSSWPTRGAARASTSGSPTIAGPASLSARGGLSRTPVDDDWGQIYAFLPAEPWVRVVHESQRPFVAHANWLEIGWALRREFWGRGYAAEIGRAGLAFAFDVLGVQAVVSCTVRHNVRSRAVMERIDMRYAGEIRSRGIAEGHERVQDDAPFAVCVLLRTDRDRCAAATPARGHFHC